MRKILVLALAGALSAFSCEEVPEENECKVEATKVETTKKSPSILYLDDLVVNNDKSIRTIIKEDEKEGISEMRKLVNSSRLEEVWLYLPDKKTWVEIGVFATEEVRIGNGYFAYSKMDADYLSEMLKKHDNIIVFHFHPLYSLAVEEMRKKSKIKGSGVTKQDVDLIRRDVSILTALPSPPDLTGMILNSVTFRKSGRLRYKVASFKGVAEFYLTKAGRKHFADKNLNYIEKYTWGLRETAMEFGKLPVESTDTQFIRSFCRYMSDRKIQVTFTPYKEIFKNDSNN